MELRQGSSLSDARLLVREALEGELRGTEIALQHRPGLGNRIRAT
jgi:hypothetical protein